MPNRRADVLASNASAPRNRSGGGRCNNAGIYNVAPAPIENEGFCWERVVACQSFGNVKYSLYEQCPERTHFTKWAASALLATLPIADKAGLTTPLLKAVVDTITRVGVAHTDQLEGILKLKHVSYCQLQHKAHPIIEDREPPANNPDYVPSTHFEKYESREFTNRTFVQAPESEVRPTEAQCFAHPKLLCTL